MTVALADTRGDRGAEDVVYAIGDIHGCYSQMVALLDRIVADVGREPGEPGGGARATLVFLGDYVDRGPASAEVLTGLIWMSRHSPLSTIFLKGNHEQVMLDFIRDPVPHAQWLRFGGEATLRSYGVDVPDEPGAADAVRLRDDLVDRLPASHLEFLRRLELFHEDDRHIFVHAGIRVGVPMAKQHAEDLLWIREGFLEERRPGRKRVVHGHTWLGDKPMVLPHRIGVDTGTYETGVLTAAKLQGDTVDFLSTAD